MAVPPNRDCFRTYGDYAFAVVGFAFLNDRDLLLSPGTCRAGGCSNCCATAALAGGSVEGATGEWTRSGGSSRWRDGVRKLLDSSAVDGPASFGISAGGDASGRSGEGADDCGRRGEGGRVGEDSAVEVGVVTGTEDLKPELVSVIQDGDVVPGIGVRGPNWERNRVAREKKKRQKRARGARCGLVSAGAGRPGLVGVESGLPMDGTVLGRSADLNLTRDNQEGFWNSCSKEVRQRLIDSKAEMHIAENLRKAKEAEERVRQMESPEALLRRAMSMVKVAEECAKKKNDSKVAGWAETVATSYAESIAKSAPSSVPSYASVLSGTSASSVSVDGTKRKKPQAPVRKLRTYEGDPQHPAKSYYERRIKYMNTPGGLDNILDELFENKALAELDRTWLINDCYEKKARLGSPSVLAVTVD